MTHTYKITGMTCSSCVSKVKSQLLHVGDLTKATVQLAFPQATISMKQHIPITKLQEAVSNAGNYAIEETGGGIAIQSNIRESGSWFDTYKPILLIGLYITGATLMAESVQGNFDWHRWMQHFMAGFFLVFSFFKLLDLKGFAESYATYDVVAKKWNGWGYIYPFAELALGMAYLANFNLVATNIATLIIMGVSIVGVLQTILNKRKIRCACLGAVFNLPMSSITIIEDAVMIAMSVAMLMFAI